MANCPHCGRKLHLYDWRPECPGCGVNLVFYNSNQALLDESEKAEKEHALSQPRIDRGKAAYAGSKLAIIRIILSLIPIGALFLPLYDNMNVLKVYDKINEAGIGNIFGGALGNPLYLSGSLLLISAVMIIVSLVLILMSLGKHGKVRVIITYGFMFLCAGGALAALFAAGKAPQVGAYLYAALMLVLFIYNIFLLKKGIPVKYTQCFIGGLPSEEYFRYVDEGMSKADIQRKMLVALAKLEEEHEQELNGEEETDNG